MTQAVQRVVIVGGGTAGWLTAGIIAARHQGRMKAGFSVTLVESPNVPIIGVGEGTWPTLRATLEKMGVSETDLFRHCDAAFKQGAKFARWTTGADDDRYYHPLMLPQGFTQVNLAPHWLNDAQGRSFCDSVCPQEQLCEAGLAPKMITTPEYKAVANYAYHLDAGKFAPFLQKHCTEKLGVRHVLADVASVNQSESGDIRSVLTKQAGEIAGRSVRRLQRLLLAAARQDLGRRIQGLQRCAVLRYRAGAAGAVRDARCADGLAHHLHGAGGGLDLGHRPADAARHRAMSIRAGTAARSRRARLCCVTSAPSTRI